MNQSLTARIKAEKQRLRANAHAAENRGFFDEQFGDDAPSDFFVRLAAAGEDPHSLEHGMRIHHDLWKPFQAAWELDCLQQGQCTPRDYDFGPRSASLGIGINTAPYANHLETEFIDPSSLSPQLQALHVPHEYMVKLTANPGKRPTTSHYDDYHKIRWPLHRRLLSNHDPEYQNTSHEETLLRLLNRHVFTSKSMPEVTVFVDDITSGGHTPYIRACARTERALMGFVNSLMQPENQPPVPNFRPGRITR